MTTFAGVRIGDNQATTGKNAYATFAASFDTNFALGGVNYLGGEEMVVGQ